MTTAQPPSDRPAPAVLVVDDEDYVADMIASALRLEGYTVHVAYNGREGLEVVLKLPLDLVIIDLMMPYLNGEALAAQIREQSELGRVPIILISAGARPRQLLPAITFVPKPFELIQMLQLIEAKIGAGAVREDGAGSHDQSLPS